MDYKTKKYHHPTSKDVPELIKSVPSVHKDFVTDMAMKMMNHPAYGKP